MRQAGTSTFGLSGGKINTSKADVYAHKNPNHTEINYNRTYTSACARMHSYIHAFALFAILFFLSQVQFPP